MTTHKNSWEKKMQARKRRAAELRAAEIAHKKAKRKDLVIKETPAFLVRFRTELRNHPDLLAAAHAGKDFSEAIGNVAAKLSIALDGEYLPESLLDMLTEAMQKRNRDQPWIPPAGVSGLELVEMVETEDAIHLLPTDDGTRLAESSVKVSGDEKLPPYTICRECTTSFECCSERSCGLGTPARQRAVGEAPGLVV
jgi:hypothetical protein